MIDQAKLEAFIKERHHMDDQQNKKLDQILLCLKGSEALNIEGVIPAQKRMESQLDELTAWKQEMNFYLGVVTSKKVWKWVLRILLFIACGFLIVRYGFESAIRYIKMLLP